MSESRGSLLDGIRAAWPPADSGSGPATGRTDLTGTVVAHVLALGSDVPPRAAVALVEFPLSSRVQAVPLVASGAGWRRADAGDGLSALLIDLLDSDAYQSGPMLLRRWDRPEGRASGTVAGERAITGDQTNESVVVGDAAVVKWLRPAPRATSRSLTLTSHLAAVGFTGMPRPLGVLAWVAPSGDEVALVHVDEFLTGAEDGYSWCVDSVLEHLEGCPADCRPGRAGCSAWFGADLGRLTAELHAALADPSGVLPEPVTSTAVDGFGARARAALDEALAATRGEQPEAAAWLASHAGRLEGSFAHLPADGETSASPVHGDLHVGQVLRWDHGLAVIDFDGNPTLAEHPLAEPVARDVAQMTCSIDHVGRIADRRTARRHHERVEQWVASSRTGFLDAYARTLADHGRSQLFDDRLLTGFEVEQECRELVYAARYLPRWAYAPLAALAARFGED